MATREQIAKRAGKLAAIAAYNAVMHAPIKKTATLTGIKTQASLKNVAKAAAKGTYEGIISLAFGGRESTPAVLEGFPNLKTLYQKIYVEMGDGTEPEVQSASAAAQREWAQGRTELSADPTINNFVTKTLGWK